MSVVVTFLIALKEKPRLKNSKTETLSFLPLHPRLIFCLIVSFRRLVLSTANLSFGSRPRTIVLWKKSEFRESVARLYKEFQSNVFDCIIRVLFFGSIDSQSSSLLPEVLDVFGICLLPDQRPAILRTRKIAVSDLLSVSCGLFSACRGKFTLKCKFGLLFYHFSFSCFICIRLFVFGSNRFVFVILRLVIRLRCPTDLTPIQKMMSQTIQEN